MSSSVGMIIPNLCKKIKINVPNHQAAWKIDQNAFKTWNHSPCPMAPICHLGLCFDHLCLVIGVWGRDIHRIYRRKKLPWIADRVLDLHLEMDATGTWPGFILYTVWVILNSYVQSVIWEYIWYAGIHMCILCSLRAHCFRRGMHIQDKRLRLMADESVPKDNQRSSHHSHSNLSVSPCAGKYGPIWTSDIRFFYVWMGF